jgi:MarR family.
MTTATPTRTKEQKAPAKIEPHVSDGAAKALPSELVNTTCIEFLERMFQFEDYVCVTWPGADGKPSRDVIKTVAEWSEIFELNPGIFDDPNGVWYCINPLKNDEQRANEQVRDFKRCLLEGDAPKDATPAEKQKLKEEMFAFFESIGLPISSIYDSAGKSIHATVEVNAKDAAEFKERVEKVYEYAKNLPGLDTGRKASAQLSRLPGAFRNGKRQSLLSWKVGTESFQDWEDSRTPAKRAVKGILGSICSIKDFRTAVVPPKAKVIGDWFQEGDIGYIFAPRGVGKTWFAFDMARAVSDGDKFGPWGVNGARPVLYVDGEVAANHMQNRAHALNLDSERLYYLNHEILFERYQETVDIGDKVWREAIMEVCKQKAIKVVFLDNLSCLSPAVDENDGVSWSSQLLNWVLAMRRLGVAVNFVQHAGRSGDNMRGHSRREDPANWIIRLDKAEHVGPEIGSKFVTVFTKNRNAPERPSDYEFWYKPEGNKTQLFLNKVSKDDLLLAILRRKQKATQKEMAEELHVNQSTISRMLEDLETDGKAEWSETKKRWRAIG